MQMYVFLCLQCVLIQRRMSEVHLSEYLRVLGMPNVNCLEKAKQSLALDVPSVFCNI